MRFESLAGQHLLGVEVFEPWAEYSAQRYAPKGFPPLCGALALLFERAALICTSPLRYLRHQQGSFYGLPSGESVSLGLRATIAALEEMRALLPLTHGIPTSVDYWHTWRKSALPVIGTRLCEVVVTMEIRTGGETSWGIELRFAKNQRFRLSYRPELDGSIELDAPGHHYNIDRIVVDGPDQDFGWLHPARLNFILDDQHWRSAEVADWPFALRKVLQSCTESDAFYRQTMRRALLAHYLLTPTES